MANNTSTVWDFKPYSIGTLDIAFAAPFALIMCLGVTGNLHVIMVVKKTRSMHTTTNYLLVNLAIVDIMILLWNPRWMSFVIYPVHPRGTLGNIICTIYTGNAIITALISVSILTLVVLAVERYNALVNAMQSKRITNEFLPFVVAAVWVSAIVVSIPDFVENYFSEQYKKCLCPFSLERASALSVQIVCTIALLGILPFLILSFCYFQILKGLFITKTIFGAGTVTSDEVMKKKLAKLCMSVTCVFYICFVPYAVCLLYLTAMDRYFIIQNQHVLSFVLRSCEFFVTLSSSINPVLYAFQSSSYQNGFKKIWRRNRKVGSISSRMRSSRKIEMCENLAGNNQVILDFKVFQVD